MDLISHQLDAILTFSAYFRFQLFVLMVLLGFHLPSNWHSFHWNECLILIIFIMIFTPLYQDIYPSLSGQLSFEWITYLPLNYWDIFLVHIYPTLSGHLPLFIRTIIFWVRDLFAPNYWDIFLILIKTYPFLSGH